MKNRAFHLVLAALLLAAPLVLADDDLPAAAPRIWAPAGDLVGTMNHATLGFQVLDAYGDAAKLAEDWQLGEEKSGSLLFGWRRAAASGHLLTLRGAGTTADGEGLSGDLVVTGLVPGRFGYRIRLARFHQFFDTDSEMRDALFGNPPPPPALPGVPLLEWKRGEVDLAWRPAGAFAVRLGLRSLDRDGDRGSLLRQATGDAVPGVKSYGNLTNREIGLGVGWAGRALAVDLDGALRVQDGDRGLGDSHTWSEDRTSYRATLGVQWQAASGSRVLGHGSLAKLENKGTETWRGNAVTPGGETTANAGQIGLIQQVGRDLVLRAAARFSSSETRADVVNGTAPQQIVDRDRTRQDYRLALTHTGLKATRLELAYRLRTSNRQETVLDGTTFTTDEDRTESRLEFKGRHRFSRNVLLKLRAGWTTRQREQARDWADAAVRYWLNDSTRDEIAWRLALQTRPAAAVRLDLGHEYTDRTITDDVVAGVETGRRVNRGFAAVNWTVSPRLTFNGTVSVGTEKMETGDAVAPDAGMGALNVDATTWRWVPGVNLQITPKLHCEAMYEGIRYEDRGDAGAALGVLQSDHDRILLRAGYRVRDDICVGATYRRAEFFEHRWDNTIHDLYGLSLTGRF